MTIRKKDTDEVIGMAEYETTFSLGYISFYSEADSKKEAFEDVKTQFFEWLTHVQHELTEKYEQKIIS